MKETTSITPDEMREVFPHLSDERLDEKCKTATETMTKYPMSKEHLLGMLKQFCQEQRRVTASMAIQTAVETLFRQ